MGVEMMSDFGVSSNGHCFFCLRQIEELQSGPYVTTQVNSLQNLTRYLKMDLKKVFVDKGQVSSELLAKVEKARLKVELCEECRCLSERFSEVYRQLEKLELELGFTLGLIHVKLIGAEASGKLCGLNSESNLNWNGLLEVLEVLRAEAVEKASYKLDVPPRLKIQKLTKKELKANQTRFKNKFRSNQESSKLPTSTDFASDRGLETRGVKVESPNDEGVSDNDNGNYFFVDSDSNIGRDPIEDNAEIGKEKIGHDNIVVTDKEDVMVSKKVGSRAASNMLLRGEWSINPETGKRKCKPCQKEFNSQPAFWYHYRNVHLKLRYKCISCNKLFGNNPSLRRHQLTSESCSTTGAAPKFNCHLCEKSFALKQGMQRHLDQVHYKLRKYKCDLCEKKYNTKTHLASHRRLVHNICGEKLTKN